MPFKYGSRGKKRSQKRKRSSLKSKTQIGNKKQWSKTTVSAARSKSDKKSSKGGSLQKMKAVAAAVANDPAVYISKLWFNPFMTTQLKYGLVDGLSLATQKRTFYSSTSLTMVGNVAVIGFNPWLISSSAASTYAQNDAAGCVRIGNHALLTVANGGYNSAGAPYGLYQAYDPADATPHPAWTTGYVNSGIIGQEVLASLDESTLGLSTYGRNWRVVSAGLQVQYTGPVQTRKGRYLLFEDPCNDGDICDANARPLDAYLADPNEEIQVPIGDEPKMVRYRPKRKEDYDFIDSRDYNANIQCRMIPSVIVIDGANVGDTFIVSWVVHVELMGRTVDGKFTQPGSGIPGGNVGTPNGPTSGTPSQAAQGILPYLYSLVGTLATPVGAAIEFQAGQAGDAIAGYINERAGAFGQRALQGAANYLMGSSFSLGFGDARFQ